EYLAGTDRRLGQIRFPQRLAGRTQNHCAHNWSLRLAQTPDFVENICGSRARSCSHRLTLHSEMSPSLRLNRYSAFPVERVQRRGVGSTPAPSPGLSECDRALPHSILL